jgi:hypothetical protein
MLQLHGSLTGRGTVYEGERLLAEAEYRLADVRELVYAPAATDGELRRELGRRGLPTVPGERSVYGLLRSPQAGVLSPLLGSRLTLRLDDERLLDFNVVQVLHGDGGLDPWANALLIQAFERRPLALTAIGAAAVA